MEENKGDFPSHRHKNQTGADQRLEPFDSERFKQKAYGLRVSASNVAAMTGFHPWKNLPELFLMQGVYQGGGLLLQHDMQLLGIQLVDEEMVLQQLATRAGVSALAQTALQVKHGQASLNTIQQATALKQTVTKQASNSNLTVPERKLLVEGIRSAVDTGYGTFHEDAALDVYEQATGDRVLHRNAQVRLQEYILDDDGVVPHSQPRVWRHKSVNDSTNAPTKCANRNDETETTDCKTNSSDTSKKETTILPFFSILGSVDGIREELDVISENNDDWTFRSVVVECKHRMRSIKTTPPLYEQIQTVAYCHLYQVDHADILQVLRNDKVLPEPKRPRMEVKKEEETEVASSLNDDNDESVTPTNTDSNTSSADGDRSNSATDAAVQPPTTTTATKTDKENAATRPQRESPNAGTSEPSASDSTHINATGSSRTQTKPDTKKTQRDTGITISIHRVSLDDPVLQHRAQWNETILPRLRLFVQAVYRVRGDDHKRYKFLAAVSSLDESDQTAWKCLFDECPWLEHCDTAFCNSRLAASVD